MQKSSSIFIDLQKRLGKSSIPPDCKEATAVRIYKGKGLDTDSASYGLFRF